ncbi:MAG: hypothetical protein LBL66_07135 [Clostridiales bacterium]|nr:hypothetical protein [Clostridiales bacterium]
MFFIPLLLRALTGQSTVYSPQCIVHSPQLRITDFAQFTMHNSQLRLRLFTHGKNDTRGRGAFLCSVEIAASRDLRSSQ